VIGCLWCAHVCSSEIGKLILPRLSFLLVKFGQDMCKAYLGQSIETSITYKSKKDESTQVQAKKQSESK
jgi:hypothetical protein